MNVFLLAMVGLATFLILVLAAFALSSCLGDEIRAAWSGRERYVPTTFGQQYARSMGHGGSRLGANRNGRLAGSILQAPRLNSPFGRTNDIANPPKSPLSPPVHGDIVQ
jgi:hypothetical protein